MRKQLFVQYVLQGYRNLGRMGALIMLGIFFVGLVCLWSYPRSGKTVVLTDLAKTHEIHVRSPFLPFRTGNLCVLYEGTLSTNAALELIFRGGGRETLLLQAGEVSGIYGGGEDWASNLSVRFVPDGAAEGTLKITAVCGRALTSEEREWSYKLGEERQRRK